MAAWLLGIVVLSGCEELPSTPAVGPRADAGEEVGPAVTAALDASWDHLVTLEGIQLAALAAFESMPPGEAAESILLEGGALDVEAAAALESDDPEAAASMAAWAEDAYLDAALTGLGTEFAAEVVASIETALERIDAAAAAGERSLRVRRSVERARARIHEARSALSRGDAAAATRAGVRAADEIRGLDPEDRARHLIGQALQLLGRAVELAGPDPRPEIAALLREADEHCETARRALDDGNWELAVREARACARLARRVIGLLSGGVSDDTLADRAAALIASAGVLYARAVELAGDDPEPEVARALDRAREYLQEAHRAFEAEAYREAIRLARESAALSGRVIGHLNGGDRPDGLQERAEQAVAHAKDLLGRADELAGDDPRPEIAALLARARSLIGQADAALEAEDWREALHHAREATAVLQRVIRLLI